MVMECPRGTPHGLALPGTPADDVTDAVLDDRGLIVLPNPRPVMITDWQRLPAGRVWAPAPPAALVPTGI